MLLVNLQKHRILQNFFEQKFIACFHDKISGDFPDASFLGLSIILILFSIAIFLICLESVDIKIFFLLVICNAIFME